MSSSEPSASVVRLGSPVVLHPPRVGEFGGGAWVGKGVANLYFIHRYVNASAHSDIADKYRRLSSQAHVPL